MNDYPEKIEVTVARLEEKQAALAGQVSEIKDNHLVHISEDIRDLQAGQTKTDLKIAYWSGSIGAVLAVLQIILKFL